MKIGICTCYDNHNYGSMLQAYATYVKFVELGYDCEFLCYRKKLNTIQKIKWLPRLLNKYLMKEKFRLIEKKIQLKKHPDIKMKDAIRQRAFDRFLENFLKDKVSAPYIGFAFAAKIGGAKKIIYHSHNSSYYPGQKLVKLSEVFKWFMPFVITDYLACSDAAARFMFPKKIVDAENYTVIKNGVDYDKHSFKPEVRTELRKKYGLENNFVLGHVGRFNVQKNHEFLIDIFYEVYKHDNSARLFLVGIGETENQIKEKVKRLGIEEVVIFHGLSDEVNRLWNMLDVFVMPSLYEGLPVAGVEAQANGLPLIVSNTITQELKITDAVEYIGLDEKTSKWCEVIERYNGYKRKNTRMEITNAGFNIDDTAIRLERIYLS